MKPHISKITVGRLYNLGSYEHVRYELSVEVPEGHSPATAMIGIERLLEALNPKPPGGVHREYEIKNEQARLDRMKEEAAKNPEKFDSDYRGFVGTRDEYLARIQEGVDESIRKREEWEARSRKARKMLEDLGGAANWRDAKLEWDDDDY